MQGLDFLTQIDTINLGVQRSYFDKLQQKLPTENRSTYRDALNHSLKEKSSPKTTERPSQNDSTKSVAFPERNARPEITTSREKKYREEPADHTSSTRQEQNPSVKNSNDDETENTPHIPETILDRLETNIAQIVSGIYEFPKAPPGLIDNFNPVISVLFDTETALSDGIVNSELEIDTEEFPVVPAGFLEALGQSQVDENRQNLLQGPEVIVDELQSLDTLIQTEVSTEINDNSLTSQSNSLSVVTEVIESETQVPVFKNNEDLEKNNPLISAAHEQLENIIPMKTVVEELKVQETSETESTETTQFVIETPIVQNESLEEESDSQPEFSQTNSDETQSESNPSTIPFVQSPDQSSKQTSTNEIDTTSTETDEKSTKQSQHERPLFVNALSQSSHRSETGQEALQVSNDGPLPSSHSTLDTTTSDSNPLIQSVNVKATTPAASTVAKDQNPVQLIERVAQSVKISQQSGRTMKFRLQPPELGTLQVEIRQDNGVMTARLEVHTAAAQKAISENMSQLREAMQHAGANIDQIDVQLIETKTDDQTSQERGQQQRQQGENRDQSRNHDTDNTESDSRDKNDPATQTDSEGEQVDIQV